MKVGTLMYLDGHPGPNTPPRALCQDGIGSCLGHTQSALHPKEVELICTNPFETNIKYTIPPLPLDSALVTSGSTEHTVLLLMQQNDATVFIHTHTHR